MNNNRKGVFLRLLPVLLVVAAVAFYYGWRRISRTIGSSRTAVTGTATEPTTGLPPGSAFSPLEQEWVDLTGGPPEWPEDFGAPVDCAAALDRIRRLAGKVDEGDYAKASGARAGTFELILQVSEALEGKEPSIGGRLDDGGAVRANIVHFVIALGPDRLGDLVQLSRGQDRMAEPMALALYQWMQAGDDCPKGFEPPRAETQYEYAAFLLQTIGGQAYLRRRSPRIEALASFYALQIADAFVARGYNPHGVDLRREIARSKALMELQPLVFRDQYLRLLGDLETRWRNPQILGVGHDRLQDPRGQDRRGESRRRPRQRRQRDDHAGVVAVAKRRGNSLTSSRLAGTVLEFP